MNTVYKNIKIYKNIVKMTLAKYTEKSETVSTWLPDMKVCLATKKDKCLLKNYM